MSRTRRLALSVIIALSVGVVGSALAHSQDSAATRPDSNPVATEVAGQRVFTAGHSFHVFIPGILGDICRGAAIAEHKQVGVQSIGGSRVIQHWELPDDKNKLKPALRTGSVDVLTLSPIYLPDPGLENVVDFALEHNPRMRVTVQEFWLPYDIYDVDYKKRRPPAPDRDARTADELRTAHAEYFRVMDEEVRRLNAKFDSQVVSVVPAGQAMIALREKIAAGSAPGLKAQSELFTDPIGHVRPAAQVLVAYCQFAVIYRRSPVGLPVPATLAKTGDPKMTEELNRLLQELAWEAVVQHPLSGVKPRSTATE